MSDRIINNRTLGECWCRGNELSIFIKKPTSTMHLTRREQCFRVQHYGKINYIHCTFDIYIFSMILVIDTPPLAIQREVWCVLCEFKNWLLFLRSRTFAIVDLYAWWSYIRPRYIESRYSFSGIITISMFSYCLWTKGIDNVIRSTILWKLMMSLEFKLFATEPNVVTNPDTMQTLKVMSLRAYVLAS